MLLHFVTEGNFAANTEVDGRIPAINLVARRKNGT